MAQSINDSDHQAQCSLAKDLFLAIEEGNGQGALRLANKICHLDGHRNERDETPLIFAGRHDLEPEAMAYLLSRSNPLLQSSDGFTALIFAAWGRASHSSELVSLLLPASDPLALSFRNDSALRYAIVAEQSRSVELLLPVSDLAQLDSSGQTPMARAMGLSDTESRNRIVRLIQAEMAQREALAIAAGASMGLPSPAKPPPRL